MQSFVHKPEAGEAYGHSGGTISFLTCFFLCVSKLYSCLQIAYNRERVHTAYTLLTYLVNEKELYRCRSRLPETVYPRHMK